MEFPSNIITALIEHFYDKAKIKDLLRKHKVSNSAFHKYAGMMKVKMMENLTFDVNDLSREDFVKYVSSLLQQSKQNWISNHFKPWLSEHEEELLVTLSIYLFRWGYPMSPEQCLATALEMAQKKGNKDSAMSRKWFRNFKRRNPR